MLELIEDLDPAATLRRAEAAIAARRTAEIDDLQLVAHWADLHAEEPDPGDGRPFSGGDRLVQVGGEGTPAVQELCLHELAIARGTHHLSTRAATADVLDLRHRLPACWMVFLDGDCDAWVVRKIASMTRHLTQAQAALVDKAVAAALQGQSPGRVMRIAEAKIIEADPEGHAAKLEAELRKRFVGCSASDEHGLRMVFARIEAGPAAWIDAIVDQLADILIARPDLAGDLNIDRPAEGTKEELRAVAFGLLAHPDVVVDLLESATTPPPDTEPASVPVRRRKRRDRVAFYLHLHQAAIDGTPAVARVEDLGPMILDQIRRFLGHAHVEVHPVIDLNTGAAVDGYEHPAAMAERARLRNPGEVFPHSNRGSRRTDKDHPDPYKPHGPPGQTRDTNLGPLTRPSHRAKTHLGYRVRQRGLDTYDWITPHGLMRRVDRMGTHELDTAGFLAPDIPELLQQLGIDGPTDLI